MFPVVSPSDVSDCSQFYLYWIHRYSMLFKRCGCFCSLASYGRCCMV